MDGLTSLDFKNGEAGYYATSGSVQIIVNYMYKMSVRFVCLIDA